MRLAISLAVLGMLRTSFSAMAGTASLTIEMDSSAARASPEGRGSVSPIRVASPNAELVDIATASLGRANGHGIIVATLKSPATQSVAENGLVPRTATTSRLGVDPS